MKHKCIATLTLHDAASWTPKQVTDIVDWLEAKKEFLLESQKQLSKCFTARYYKASRRG